MDQHALVHSQLVVVGGNHDKGMAVEDICAYFALEAKADHRVICIVSTVTKKLGAYMRNAISKRKHAKGKDRKYSNEQRKRGKENLETAELKEQERLTV